MSETLYTDEEIQILQSKIIDDIVNKCLECKNPKSNDKKCTHTMLNFTEDNKILLIENLQKYKIIGCKIKFIREKGMVDTWGCNTQSMGVQTNTYIHYINIHGDVYTNNNITPLGHNYYPSIGDIIDYPFYILQGYKSYQYDRSYASLITSNYNYSKYSSHDYIKKSFIIPKNVLNIILMTDYFKYLDISSSVPDFNCNFRKEKYIFNNNIYINFMKYIIKEYAINYISLFYHSSDIDLDNIKTIEITNKKEIDEYYDTIEKENAKKKQDEIDRIAKEEQEELDRIVKDKQDELDRIAKEKQDEIDRIAKEKKDELDKENEIKRLARGNITIENNTLTIENNTYNELNLCDYLSYKTKKICDDSGNIKNIRYTEITHITFINCKLSEISKYYTGITHLTFIKCNNFKTMSRYLKAELNYLKINNEVLINKTDENKSETEIKDKDKNTIVIDTKIKNIIKNVFNEGENQIKKIQQQIINFQKSQYERQIINNIHRKEIIHYIPMKQLNQRKPRVKAIQRKPRVKAIQSKPRVIKNNLYTELSKMHN